jgi:hypothetical protein
MPPPSSGQKSNPDMENVVRILGQGMRGLTLNEPIGVRSEIVLISQNSISIRLGRLQEIETPIKYTAYYTASHARKP